MPIYEQIKNTKLSPNEEEAFTFLEKEKYNIQDLTLQDLATKSFVSPATFVRLAKKCHYKGWKDFKAAYLKELSYIEKHTPITDLNIPFTNEDHLLSIADKITEIKKEALDDTIELLSYKDLSKAVNILNKASEIKIFGSHVNLLFAQEFQYKMNRIRHYTSVSLLEGEQLYDIFNLRDNAVAIVISYTGSSSKIIEIMETLSEHKIPTIAITGLTENALAEKADVILRTATRERLYSKIGQYSTDTSIKHLLDILYSGLFAKDFQKNIDHIFKTSKKANYREGNSKYMAEDT